MAVSARRSESPLEGTILDSLTASLFAPLAAPKEHPTYTGLQLPPNLAAELVGWQERPSVQWVRESYTQYRRP
ncbi:MAG: hypothetical protein OEU49_11970 [Chromatiales bacterium]|nr:hypothetical protein [Chromatiales bacterium]